MSLGSSVDFESLNIEDAMAHVKYRDPKVKRKRGIGGCHDLNEWNKLRSISESEDIPIGLELTDNSAPEVIIRKKEDHEKVPGVKIIHYSIPTVDRERKTDGGKKDISDPKTVYNPNIWTDDKLKQALKEALQDASDKRGNIPSQWSGQTTQGYTIMGFIRDGKLATFFFA